MFGKLNRSGAPALVGRVVQIASGIVVVLAPLLLIAWSIAPLRAWLERNAYFDKDTLVALLGLVVSLTLVNFHHLLKRTENVNQLLSDMSKSRSGVIANGVSEVYPELMAELKNLPKHERSVEILGLNLFTAWNQLQGFLHDQDVRGWKVHMLCICPDFAQSGVRGIPPEWGVDAQNQVNSISRYMQQHRDNLKDRNIVLGLTTYRAFPAMHGFMLGNGALFISWTQWEPDGDLLAKPYHPYEKIDASDRSKRAEIYREMFRNWTEHARRTSDGTVPAPTMS